MSANSEIGKDANVGGERLSEHTPGPWTWGPGWRDVEGTAGGVEGEGPKYADLRLLGSDGTEIMPLRVDHYDLLWDAEAVWFSEADRALIRAAPDLLAALEAVVAVADRATVEFDMAHAAIEKARGPLNDAPTTNSISNGGNRDR